MGITPSSFQRDGDILRIEEDQEEGGMTLVEVVNLALDQGYTEVKTASGWIGLKAWTPYGKVDGHAVLFGLANNIIRESLPTMAAGYGLPHALGIWELR